MKTLQVLDKYRKQLVFLMSGLAAMLLGTGALIVSVEALGTPTWAAYLIQAFVAIQANFLLNSRLTWRDRARGDMWGAWRRFNVSRVFTIALNQALFTVLVLMSVPYLLAHFLCILLSTVVNYTLGDKVIFKAKPQPTEKTSAVVRAGNLPAQPKVSIVVPCKRSQRTIRKLVDSLLAQRYPGDIEIILVGDEGDPTWGPLVDLMGNARLRIIEVDVRAPARDANAKRSIGLEAATGDVIALTDTDMWFEPDWVATGVWLTRSHGAVAGSMIAEGTGFWGRYVDGNAIGAKTPRMSKAYVLTQENYGKRGYKPPITATFFCTRDIYLAVGGPDIHFSRSYEDYIWFRRFVDLGYTILCDERLAGHHAHREGMRSLWGEYLRSGWGAADYVVSFPSCRLARTRLVQWPIVVTMPFVLAAAAATFPWLTALVTGSLLVVVCVLSWAKVKRIDALLYPVVTLLLGIAFAHGMSCRFIRYGWSKPSGVQIRSTTVLQGTGEQQ